MAIFLKKIEGFKYKSRILEAVGMLVKVEEKIPGLKVDLVYATERNFTGQRVYPKGAVACLLEKPAERLKRVHQTLQREGLGLKIFDAYRPLSVQRKFWEIFPDPRYVADPSVGSKHNRGAAVDLTLVDAEGRELPMPSDFDDFSEKAHHEFRRCAAECIQNRAMLKEAMMREGFVPYLNEWWHYDDPEWDFYPILDLSFEELFS